jgi:hypothetical protein
VNEDAAPQLPKNIVLQQNFPNPFNPTTTIEYELPQLSIVSLRVYNILGEQLAVLVNERQDAGHKSVRWDAKNLPSGVYTYRLSAGNFSEARKLVIMK